MNPTDPTPLPCPTLRTDAAEQARQRFNASWGKKERIPWAPDGFDFARQLETELAQAQAEAAAMREALERMVQLYESEHDDPTQYRPDWLKGALATTAGAELLERLRKAEAERDAWSGKAQAESALIVKMLDREERITAERDAANALVEIIKQEADKLHSECIRDGETDAYCLTSEQIAALAKHFLPTTTENTKPQ